MYVCTLLMKKFFQKSNWHPSSVHTCNVRAVTSTALSRHVCALPDHTLTHTTAHAYWVIACWSCMSCKPLACLSAHVHACLCCHVTLMLCCGSVASQPMHLHTRVLQLPMSRHYSIMVARAMSSSAAHVPHTLLRSSLHQYGTKYVQQRHIFHMDREQRATKSTSTGQCPH
jgi:hypothetical protein